MTAIYYILVVVGGIALAIVWLRLADAWEVRRAAQGIRSICAAECPRCKQVLGDIAASAAKWKMIKYARSGWRLRGRDSPSRLATVICPHCAAELEFRLDGSLFSCDHEVAA
jgi:hypothetical protein